MRFTFLLAFIFGSYTAMAQVTNVQVEPAGIYKEINTSQDLNICQRMTDSVNKDRMQLIDSVMNHPNGVTPPVLYIMSAVLFKLDKKPEAAYWFYLAQLRGRYDTNRCTDKTASAANYNTTFGPPINQYAFKDLDLLESIVNKVVKFVRENEEQYDPRWIALEGMGVFKESLGGEKNDNSLMLPKEQWPAIKTKTVDTYLKTFYEYLTQYRANKK